MFINTCRLARSQSGDWELATGIGAVNGSVSHRLEAGEK